MNMPISMLGLRRLLARLSALLRPSAAVAPARGKPVYMPIGSYSRRYPGLTTATDLRRNLGWVAVMAARSHRDRRA
jgi:hypothetical protein